MLGIIIYILDIFQIHNYTRIFKENQKKNALIYYPRKLNVEMHLLDQIQLLM